MTDGPPNRSTRLYEWGRRWRWALFGATALSLIVSAALTANLKLSGDIVDMLPADEQLLKQVDLLQHSPLAGRVLITLTGDDRDELVASVDALTTALAPPHFTRVIGGVSTRAGAEHFMLTQRSLPRLLDEIDLEHIDEELTTAGVRSRLRTAYETLISPQSAFLKDFVRRDPLGLGMRAMARLGALRPSSSVELTDGRFLSGDGRHALVIAETDVSMTDAIASEELMAAMDEAFASSLRPGVEAAVVAGHRFSIHNASTIKRDIIFALTFSTVGILLLFIVAFRRWRALLIFLVPAAAAPFAMAAAKLIYGELSGLSIGFGAVLLGISVDYAIHVYCALQDDESPGEALSRVSRPIAFGLFTTVAAFAMLMTSAIPVQRQIAGFSIVGLLYAVTLAMVVAPHLFRSGGASRGVTRSLVPRFPAVSTRVVVVGWLAIAVTLGVMAPRARFDAELRNLNSMSDEMRRDEELFRDTWGMQSRKMIVVEGDDLQDALTGDDGLYYLRRRKPTVWGSPDDVISLAPLLPSHVTQDANLDRWREFWRDGGEAKLRALIESERGAFGFSAKAFEPFFEGLDDEPPVIEPEAILDSPFGELARSCVMKTDAGVAVISLAPDDEAFTAETLTIEDDLSSFLSQWRISVVSPKETTALIARMIHHDFIRFVLLATAAVVLLTAALFGWNRRALAALAPVVAGLLSVFGLMGAFGLPINLVNVMLVPLVMGLGVDYGIFMACDAEDTTSSARQRSMTRRAVFVSALTTLIGFGAIALSRHPSLNSIGLSVVFGVAGAAPTALFITPLLARGRKEATE